MPNFGLLGQTMWILWTEEHFGSHFERLKIGRLPKNVKMQNFGWKATSMPNFDLLGQTMWN